MCYAIPGKVEKVNKNSVTLDYFREKRKALNELVEIKAGDYVYAQGGFVVNKIAPSEAESVLANWKEMFFELQKVDLKLSRLELGRENKAKKLLDILGKASRSEKLSRPELL